MKKLIDFFKLLSDETRLRIVVLLAQHELCVCEICGVLGLSQPKVSKHLAKLRDMGFVSTEKKEQFVFYKLNVEDKVIKKLIDDIKNQVDEYTQLAIDSRRLSDKDMYLNQCKVK
ncbi:HTH-type transcriptional repressor AseR [Clostridium tepidiprofundi DSM 19306]|uniref:HTH-type transcriptional repressor AseR n=1 Tax=Clostridium tepidiprofundi DSM 19306 TaxID=1121338 RepID=A0A151B300_9CLOT|nr:metalloregulator ArsR/SmtB family transcription factor [Clostridium tepidiprofundi]KYH34285.1 HTH-type transcriptional repressor AseR [Clostridium tepidiprofundi DSM 19306]